MVQQGTPPDQRYPIDPGGSASRRIAATLGALLAFRNSMTAAMVVVVDDDEARGGGGAIRRRSKLALARDPQPGSSPYFFPTTPPPHVKVQGNPGSGNWFR